MTSAEFLGDGAPLSLTLANLHALADPATLRVAPVASKDRGTRDKRAAGRQTTTMAQTTLDDWARDPVDPEIRAHVYSLITAVSFDYVLP